MLVVDPDGTLLKVALLSLLGGILWGLLSAGSIYLGSTLIPPRIRRGQIWAEWRRRRVLWGLSLVLGGIAAWLTAEVVYRRVALLDLYWIGKQAVILWVARLGVGCGYLLVLFILVTAALIARRHNKGRSQKDEGRSD